MRDRECEVFKCDRIGITDIPTTNRDGSVGELIVCEPCHNAWKVGRNDPNA